MPEDRSPEPTTDQPPTDDATTTSAPAGDLANAPAEHPTTFAGNRSLDSRWWWSASLWIVVGAVVIAYQVSAYTGDGGIWLNGVMIAIGAVVAVTGLVRLARAHQVHRSEQARARTGTPPPA